MRLGSTFLFLWCIVLFCHREDEEARELAIYRDRLMSRWRRECTEVDHGFGVVERESEELEEISNDPSQAAMYRAKFKVRELYC